MTNEFEFRKWAKTKRFVDVEMVITQKMDGTNAQILFSKDSTPDDIRVMAGSRNRWLSSDKDNFGFHEFVAINYKELFAALGPGRHYGEWCGPQIQTTEGLDVRKFFTFNSSKEIDSTFQHLVSPVAELYRGPIDLHKIIESLEALTVHGSYYNGFHPVEGIIVSLSGVRYKIYLDQLESVKKLVKGDLE